MSWDLKAPEQVNCVILAVISHRKKKILSWLISRPADSILFLPILYLEYGMTIKLDSRI